MSTLQTSTPDPSDFSHIFNTYAVPTPKQKESIQTFISTRLTPDLEETERQRERACLLVKELERKMSTLKASIVLHQAMLSPWRRIPPEIWGEIFTIVVSLEARPKFESWGVNGNPDAISLECVFWDDCLIVAPFTLARVCRKWRQIMFQRPELWSNINICFSSHSPESKTPRDFDPVLASLREQVDISSHTCLSVAFCICEDKPNRAVIEEIKNILSPHMHRFRHLWLSSHAFDFFPGPYPRLASVAILDSAWTAIHPGALSKLYSSIQDAAQLTSIDLKLPSHYSEEYHYPFSSPWDQLVNLKSWQHPTTIPRFIAQVMPQLTTNIVDLTLKFHRGVSKVGGDPLPRFIMPSLKSLSLSFGTSAPIFQRFISLFYSCPSLRSLSIHAHLLPDFTKVITTLLHRSQCSLTSFAIAQHVQERSDSGEVDIVRQLLSEESVYKDLRKLTVGGFKTALDIDPPSLQPDDLSMPCPSYQVLLGNIQSLALLNRSVDLDGKFCQFLEAACRHNLQNLKLGGVTVHHMGQELSDKGAIEQKLERFGSMGLQLEVLE